MPDVKRKGVSLVESLILIIVLLVTMGAIFATMAWSQRNYAFHRQDKESREILFAWVQTFESMWPPEGMHLWDNPTGLGSQAGIIIRRVGNTLGEWDGSDDGLTGVARISGASVRAEPTPLPNLGRIDINIVVRMGAGGASGPRPVDLTRSYNIYSSDTVSDDVLKFGEV